MLRWASIISSTCSRYFTAALEVQMLSVWSRPPFRLHLAPRSNKQTQSVRHERDHQKRCILPTGSSRPSLLSPPPPDHIVCVCVYMCTLSVEFPCVCQLSVTHKIHHSRCRITATFSKTRPGLKFCLFKWKTGFGGPPVRQRVYWLII